MIRNALKNPLVWFLPLLAIALQVQLSLFQKEGYLGIRLSAADLLLPLAGLCILFSLLRGKSLWPRWSIKGIYLGLAALTFIMTFALINGYLTTGSLSTWALANKYCGWFLLVAYFGLGAWLATNLDETAIERFCRWFIMFFFVVLIGGLLILMAATILNKMHIGPVHYPFDGVMGNRNAYAFLMNAVILLATAWYARSQPQFLKIIAPVIWLILPFAFVYVGSRAGWIAFFAVYLILLALFPKRPLLKLLGFFTIGALTASLFFYVQKNSSIMHSVTMITSHTGQVLLGENNNNAPESWEYGGDRIRTTTFTDAYELWLKRPSVGSGLGSYRDYQTEKHGKYFDVIDSTPLWLMAETGLFGLFSFLAFYFICLLAVWKNIRQSSEFSPVAWMVLLAMLTFGLMCLLHEILYTRFLWFFMGLAVALPVKKHLSGTIPG